MGLGQKISAFFGLAPVEAAAPSQFERAPSGGPRVAVQSRSERMQALPGDSTEQVPPMRILRAASRCDSYSSIASDGRNSVSSSRGNSGEFGRTGSSNVPRLSADSRAARQTALPGDPGQQVPPARILRAASLKSDA